MCGIAGYVASVGETPSLSLLTRMCDVIRHRGPDSAGYRLDGPAALGMRRLKIIDLATGDQPIAEETGRSWIVFNGEIYNYPELRTGLLERGHTLATSSDTETIVHLYQERDTGCLDVLRGMFAFALWDSTRQRLLLARDRLGVKPLYYAPLPGGGLVFGSEIKSILQHPAVRRNMDPEAIDSLLAYRYIPEPLTGFVGIFKLPAGSFLTWQDGAYRIERYWELNPQPLDDVGSEEEWTAQLLDRLRDAVRIRMISEVPLGALLSGGIDSSMVVGLMAEASAKPIQTFSIGFPGTGRSELPQARAVARHFGTDHHEFDAEPTQLEELLPELVWHFDEPFGDSSSLPTYLVSRLARSAVTVALSGDGGDEAFAGYTMFRGEAFSQAYQRLPGIVGRWAVPGLAGLAARMAPGRLAASADRANRVVHEAGLDVVDRTYHKLQYFSDAERRSLQAPSGLTVNGQCRALLAETDRRGGRSTPFDRLSFLLTRFYLPNDMLVKVDRMSMAHSLEARGPFLDQQLVSWTASLPSHLKLRHGETKYLLKRLARNFLPPEIVQRPKQGFEVPLTAWFRTDLHDFARGLLLAPDSACRRVFSSAAVETAVATETLSRGGSRAAEKLWILLNFEYWHRMYLDNQFGKF